jgi:hypothetical protein
MSLYLKLILKYIALYLIMIYFCQMPVRDRKRCRLRKRRQEPVERGEVCFNLHKSLMV